MAVVVLGCSCVLGVLVLVAVVAGVGTSRAGSSFMPHCGQWSGVSLVTSGCIGHT